MNNSKDDLKNFCVAVLLSVCVVMGVNYFFPPAEKDVAIEEEQAATNVESENREDMAATDENLEKAEPVSADVEEVIAQDVRLPISNQSIKGSLRLKGARFDEILLSKYKETIEKDSPDVTLFAPAKTADAFFAQQGWLSADSDIVLPTSDTIWHIAGNSELTPDTPVTLFWENGRGLKFIYEISLDDNYLFNIKQSVENNTGKAITLIPYGLLSKRIEPNKYGRSVVHEGFTGIIDDDLKEVRYGDIGEDAKSFDTTGGWISFSDKYWLGSLIFNDNYQVKVDLRKINDDTYQLDYKGLPIQVQAGNAASVSTRLYAGAKEIKLLDKYAKSINKFDLTVDFGWYYFLTKPFFYILDFFYHFIGNMGWAILLFAALLRLLMFPIANKSFDSMSKMKKVQPKIMALQAMYKDDKVALQRATMELYKKEKVNPAAGCLPMFIQIPIFFSLYKVLNISIEIRHAPFIGWIKDLSAPDPLTISSWAHIWVPSILDIGVWPIIYGLTMLLQMKLSPKPANKDQARAFMIMPILFTVMFAQFAVGLVIYWTFSNVFSLIQQKIIMRKNGVK